MASKPRNRAGMDAAAVARMMAEQDQAEQEAPAVDPTPAEASAPAPAAPVVEAAPPLPVAPPPAEPPAPWDPGKVDGRTLRRTGREPFATRIKPETHEALRRIAYERRITMAEALELAVAAFARR